MRVCFCRPGCFTAWGGRAAEPAGRAGGGASRARACAGLLSVVRTNRDGNNR
ncbi:hypothetical protein [uncultured Hymenobacter sp.]|uniref:hypothetical protein n=1 Tax=uncultured Hymenobacter sp. TaxID=170016 RepID=UPI0035C969B7